MTEYFTNFRKELILIKIFDTIPERFLIRFVQIFFKFMVR